MKHYPWTHIEAFKNVNRYIEKYIKDEKPVVEYCGKIKLHGTNAGIQINKDGVFAQSRNNMITPESDNAGFAKWVEDKKEDFQHIFDSAGDWSPENCKYIFYGEWAGKGIMKGTSVSKIGKRIFAIFALRVVSDEGENIIFEPSELEYWCQGLLKKYDDVHILPWGTETISCNFNNRQSILMAVQKFNEYVEKVEKTDPWVKETFGVDGNGEGYVFYPYFSTDYDQFSYLVFKAKGNKHQKEGVKAKKFVKISPEILNSINEFADMYVTVDRLEQAVCEACENEYDVKHTGIFMKWIGNDIKREGLAELEANGLEWKQVAREVSTRARQWWLDKCKEIL